MSERSWLHSQKLPPLNASVIGKTFNKESGRKSQERTGIPVLKVRQQQISPLMVTSREKMDYHHGLKPIIRGHQVTPRSSASRSGHRKRNHSQAEKHISSYDLNPDIVSTYLHDNPEFLEQYVLRHTSSDQIEGWLKKKANQHIKGLKHTTTDHGVQLNGDFTPKENILRWKFSVQGDKRLLLQNLTNKIQQNHSKGHLLNEIASCCAAAIEADGFNVYLVNERDQEIYLYQPITESASAKLSSQCTYKIGPGSTIAAFVAYIKDSMFRSPLQKDARFPDGMGILEGSVHSVILHPVFSSSGAVLGVVEIYRSKTPSPFISQEEEVCSSIVMVGDLIMKCHERCGYLLVWGEATLYIAELYHDMIRQRKLNDFLLTVTKSIFQDIVSMDTVIMKIMHYARSLVNADRASLFLVDRLNSQLYARIFDMGQDKDNLSAEKEIRFSMNKGVAGYVASSGEILNICDAYSDHRFNRNVDLQTGYRTKTILCMPIYIRGNIIGVVQMVNKLDGLFTKGDEEAFETFAVYCGLALHHAKLYEKIRRSEQKYRVALEVLSYHAQAGEDEVSSLSSREVPQQIPDFIHYDFSPWAVSNDDKPLHVIYMFRELFGKTRVDMESLYRFTLTVKKNYRAVPYHNWAHAFSVAHAMFTVIKTTKNEFSSLEQVSLFVACLCHDLDHRGKTNSFMVKSATPLAALYSTSTMEHHHFNQTVAILQNEGHNIFRNLSPEEYKQVLGDVKHCILSTDLALFFGNRARLKEMCDDGEFDWNIKEHRKYAVAIVMTGCDLVASAKPWKIQLDIVKAIFAEFYDQYSQMVMANSMTACDLCSMYKPWNLQLQLVHVIMEEFWIQGDEEKRKGITPIPMLDREKADQLPQSQGDKEKEAGEVPMAMMDRDKQNELPNLEVGFLVGICLPCYELLAQILPETKPMVDGAKDNLRRWQELVDEQEALKKKAAIKDSEEKKS